MSGTSPVKANVYSRAALSLLVDTWQESMLALGLFGSMRLRRSLTRGKT